MLTLHAWDFVSENRFGNMPRARPQSLGFYHPKTKNNFLSRARAQMMVMIFIFLFF